jgi:hypothetical protein
MGLQLLEDDYPRVDSNSLHNLSEKYRNDQVENPRLQYVIKNTRRRLYDAINVMLAANVLKKKVGEGSLRLWNKQVTLNSNKRKEMIDEEEEDHRNTFVFGSFEENI